MKNDGPPPGVEARSRMADCMTPALRTGAVRTKAVALGVGRVVRRSWVGQAAGVVFGRAVRNAAGWGFGRREYAAAGRAAARTSGYVAGARGVAGSSGCGTRNPEVQGTKVVSAARKAHAGPAAVAAAAAGVGRRRGGSAVGSVVRNGRTDSQSAAAAAVGVGKS